MKKEIVNGLKDFPAIVGPAGLAFLEFLNDSAVNSGVGKLAGSFSQLVVAQRQPAEL